MVSSPCEVAELVGVDDRLHVVVQAHGPEGGHRLVLRLVRIVDGYLPRSDLSDAAAGDGAARAGIFLVTYLAMPS